MYRTALSGPFPLDACKLLRLQTRSLGEVFVGRRLLHNVTLRHCLMLQVNGEVARITLVIPTANPRTGAK
jgi:hypothetical protein